MNQNAAAEMPFLDHLEELRQRLLRAGAALAAGTVVAFAIISRTDIIGYLQRPIRPYLHGQTLVYTHPGAVFGIIMDIALVLGLLVASPVIGYQLWLFLAPALYPHERKLAIPLISGMVLLFAAGVALSFFVVLPLTLRFLLGLQAGALTPMITASEYFGFAVTMSLMFGVVFELPIAVLALTVLGVVTPAFLVRYRRHALILCLVTAAFVTPGADPTSLFALAVPLYLLYEVSVFLSRIVYRRRQRKAREGSAMLAVGVAAILAVIPSPARAQQVSPTSVSASDSAARDSTRNRLITWVPADSVAAVLMERPGYTVTRYQGERVILNASTRTLRLEGHPGAVARGAAELIGDTILYNDSTHLVLVRGDTNILRDPGQNATDVVAHGSLTYDIARGRGAATNISTALESGDRWFVEGTGYFVRDTSGVLPSAFYVRGGAFTTCDDSIPDYHFKSKQIKLISRNFIVARPAILYIGEVPVLWLPFVFQDIRSGRRSGVLPPRFGVSELLRSSATYRRHIENIGYYFAISDYLDTQLWFDWRSGSRSSEQDPGWSRSNGEIRYRWLNRFLTGRLAASHTAQQDGHTNTAISWAHQQDFSQTRHLTTNLNYVTSTRLQTRNSFDPRQVLATISSQANYQHRLGPADLAIGGSRTQNPGRRQVEQTLPTLSLAAPTLALAKWLDWTPSFSMDNRQVFNLDQPGTVGFRYFTRADGFADSAQVKGNHRETTATFTTPLKIFGFTWTNSFRMSDGESNFPTSIVVVDPVDTAKKSRRTFARTFHTLVDWETGFSLPPVLSGTWNVVPSIGLRNVDPSSFWIRSQFTGGHYVHQRKRADYGLSISPTFFALFPGLGPVTRLRHAISPRIGYAYSPRAMLDREFLRATNRTAQDYLGANAQNTVTLSLSQNLEARVRDDRDSSTAANGRKIKLLSLNFSPLSYDFERKRKTGKSGFTTPTFGYDVTSELLPSFSLRVDYSLFQGNPLSDTAVFKPYREGISASFTINQQSGLFAAINRLFGRAVPQTNPQLERLAQALDDALAQRVAGTPVAGSQRRDRQLAIPETQGWQASVTYSSRRQRPPVGGHVIDFDPAQNCAAFAANPIVYNVCLLEQQSRPTSAVPFTQDIGAPFIRTPSRETVSWQSTFHVTPKWSGNWGTTYDFKAREFASHTVALQRELHDWRSIFAFTKAPNGNFAFTFLISLNAQPDLKFNYDKQTYRPITR